MRKTIGIAKGVTVTGLILAIVLIFGRVALVYLVLMVVIWNMKT